MPTHAPNAETLAALLKQYWGFDQFRPLQGDIIHSISAGRDTLAVLPTGGGKSLCFQLPALASEGTCLVISPLIALMRDQVEQLRKRNIPAAGLFSGLHHNEAEVICENFVNKVYKLLYISPERLQSERFQEYLRHANLSFMAVDESHCISQWGYDFRPSYLKINTIRDFFPDIPMIALTASATPKVQTDIQEKLEMKNPAIFHGSFLRPNLSFSVFELENKGQKMVEILRAVRGSAVVYVQTRKSASIWSSWLIQNGLNSDYYHAGLSHKDRDRKQRNWIDGKIAILVATNAFGMGIDKGDVRTVIHIETPIQPEAYYQEAGRAGRDGQRAFAVSLFTRQELVEARKRIEQHYPTPDTIRNTYNLLCSYLKLAFGSGELASFDFELERFCKTFSLQPGPTYQALRKLEIAEYLMFNEGFHQPSRFHFTANSAQLYEAQVKNSKIDQMSKALLRLYGGQLFSEFVPIKEGELAAMIKMPVELAIEQLQLLHKQELGQYEVQSERPQVTFLTERLEAKNLNLNLELLRQLKQNEIDRLKTMENYLTMSKGCRSTFLATYFGEEAPTDCGICDHCLKKKQQQRPSQFEYFKSIILKELISPTNSSDFEMRFKPSQREEVRRALKFLLEEGSLQFDREGNISVVEKRG